MNIAKNTLALQGLSRRYCAMWFQSLLVNTIFSVVYLSVGVQAGSSNFFREAGNNCVLTVRPGGCTNFPRFGGNQFADSIGQTYLDLSNPSACLRRAEDFHHWCGNGREEFQSNTNTTSSTAHDLGQEASVAATFLPTGDTQIYFADACPRGWSLYRDNCYIHVWRAKTWWEAEDWCVRQGEESHLCSIHGKAENEFVFTLTKGLSSWIGYHDAGDEEEKQWSDDSKTDYDNMHTNCTGREHEPDCAPQEVAQQWFDWDGIDRGTWVCKKPAKWRLRILRNDTTLESLTQLEWNRLKVPFNYSELVEDVGPLKLGPSQKELEEKEEVLPPKRKSRVDLGKVPTPSSAKGGNVCEDCE